MEGVVEVAEGREGSRLDWERRLKRPGLLIPSIACRGSEGALRVEYSSTPLHPAQLSAAPTHPTKGSQGRGWEELAGVSSNLPQPRRAISHPPPRPAIKAARLFASLPLPTSFSSLPSFPPPSPLLVLAMTIGLPHPLGTALVQNRNHKAVFEGREAMFVPTTHLDKQQAKDEQKATSPAPDASKNCPAPATVTPTTANTQVSLPPCNPPNIFTATPQSKLTARRFLDQCQLVFDYTDASANQVQGPKMTDEQKILYAATFMRATAGDWVKGWRANPNTEGKSWEHFEKAVMRRFRIKVKTNPQADWSVRFSSIHAVPAQED